MSCPWCQHGMNSYQVILPLPYDHTPGEDQAVILREMGEHFSDLTDISPTVTHLCSSCGSSWGFELEAGNVDPRDSSMGSDWYRISCRRKVI